MEILSLPEDPVFGTIFDFFEGIKYQGPNATPKFLKKFLGLEVSFLDLDKNPIFFLNLFLEFVNKREKSRNIFIMFVTYIQVIQIALLNDLLV